MSAVSKALSDVHGLGSYGRSDVFSRLNQSPSVRKIDDLSTVIIRKESCGFQYEHIAAFAEALEQAMDDQPKFLVFDFAHRHGLSGMRDGFSGFPELIHTCANLIASSSTIAIAWARGPMAGADLEFALSCSMIAAESTATFLPSPHGTAYPFLARKIGLSRAERLMLDSEELSASAMKDMLLIRHIEDAVDDGDRGLENYVHSNLRRHNALVHMYRAQRLVMPVPFEMVKAAQAA